MAVTLHTPAVMAFDLEVRATRRLSPTFLRLTLGGDALANFADCGLGGPQDLRVKVAVPTPGHPMPDLGDLSPGWYQRWCSLDPGRRGAIRTYTVRSARLGESSPEVDIDFVVHDQGRVSSWARHARPGDPVTLIGPHRDAVSDGRREWHPPRPSPGRPVRVLLVGDETAVPAVGSILETLPAGYYGHALLEVPVREDFLDLRTASDVEVCWFARDQQPRGLGVQAALDAVTGRGADLPAHADVAAAHADIDHEVLWESSSDGNASADAFYGWVAGEAGVVRSVRRRLLQEFPMARGSVAFMGYWRSTTGPPAARSPGALPA
jgi:iron complex transport system ATP-binding protein